MKFTDSLEEEMNLLSLNESWDELLMAVDAISTTDFSSGSLPDVAGYIEDEKIKDVIRKALANIDRTIHAVQTYENNYSQILDDLSRNISEIEREFYFRAKLKTAGVLSLFGGMLGVLGIKANDLSRYNKVATELDVVVNDQREILKQISSKKNKTNERVLKSLITRGKSNARKIVTLSQSVEQELKKVEKMKIPVLTNEKIAQVRKYIKSVTKSLTTI